MSTCNAIPHGQQARALEEANLRQCEQLGFDTVPAPGYLKRLGCEEIYHDQTGARAYRCPDGSILHVNECGCYAAEGNE